MGRGAPKTKAAHLSVVDTKTGKAKRVKATGSGNKHKTVDAYAGVGELGEPPDYFDEHQRQAWEEIAEKSPKGALSGSDRALVEVSARNLAAIRQQTTPLTAAQSAEMRRCLGEMGMTPSERARMVPPEGGDANEFDDL